MSNAIKPYEQQEIERTFEGKRVRTSKEQLHTALGPMFAMFPNLEMGEKTFNAYYMMLADLDPNRLAVAVVQACQAHEYPTQLITVAAIRKAYEQDARPPGPSNDIDPTQLKPIPDKMFRLDPEEDKRQRLERLRQTRGWKYA
jgi:hypothetical protein